METPAPVNLDRLKGILGNAKAVMNKAESLKPTTLSETTQRQIEAETIEEPEGEVFKKPQGYTKEDVMKSRLPEAVKQAMINNPIPQLVMPPSKFTLEDMNDVDDDRLMTPNKRTQPIKVTTPIRENIVSKNSDMITISRSELNEMINAKLMAFLTESYNKNLTEETIKRTINTLIKEGKISTKK